MRDPLISIVLPTKDRAHVVSEAIRSVLDQTDVRLELIVVDDASTDGTRAVLDAMKDERIRVVSLPSSRGASGARNAGIELARGDWIAFQDSDDRWMPDKLRKQMECALAHPGCVAVYTSYWRNDGTVREVRPRPGPGLDGDVLPRLVRANFITTQTLLVRKEPAREIGGFDLALSALNDWEYAIRLARRGRIQWVSEPLAEYRLQADSLSVSLDRFVGDYRHILEKHRALMCPDHASEAWHEATIGNRLCREGDRRRGRGFLARAWRVQPFDSRYAGAWFFSWLPSPAYRMLAQAYAALRSR